MSIDYIESANFTNNS